MMVIGGFVAFASIAPLYSRLKEAAQYRVVHALELEISTVEEFLSRARNVTLLLANQSDLRAKMEEYNKNEITLWDLAEYTTDKLYEAMQRSEEVAGITRLDAKGNPVVRVGLPVAREFWIIPPVGAAEAVVGSLVRVEDESYLVVAAPILSRRWTREGTDVILFSAQNLHRSVQDLTSLGLTGEYILGSGASPQQLKPFFPLRDGRTADALPEDIRESLPASLPNTSEHSTVTKQGFVSVAGRVPSTGWQLIVRIAASELFEGVEHILAWVLAGVIVFIGLSVLGLALLLRPLTGSILVHTKVMQRQIAQLKAVHRALEDKTDKLAASNAELERFAYVASHDLQEPLRTITSYVQLLQRRYQDRLGPEANEFIGYVVQGATRMRSQIHDLLDYARTARDETPFVSVPLEEPLRRAIANLRRALSEADAIVTHDPLPAVPGNPHQLERLFQNLIANAVKFRRGDVPPRVHILVEQSNGFCQIGVQDNGIGIDPAFSEQVFAMFQRLHRSDDYPGTGIGLTMCRRIVEHHGGRIWLSSTPGQGATFWFTLPEATTTIPDDEEAVADA